MAGTAGTIVVVVVVATESVGAAESVGTSSQLVGVPESVEAAELVGVPESVGVADLVGAIA